MNLSLLRVLKFIVNEKGGGSRIHGSYATRKKMNLASLGVIYQILGVVSNSGKEVDGVHGQAYNGDINM